MTTLIDRYVYTVLRRVPEQQRTDIDRELRTSIEDAVEARVSGGAPPDTALQQTLLELGDPDRLADGYADRKQYLIGPDLFPIWQRLLTMLLTVVLPIVVVIAVVIQVLDDPAVGPIIGAAVSSAITVGAHLAFWATLVVAVLERTGVTRSALRGGTRREWSLDDLPRYEPRAIALSELVAGVLWPVLLIAGLVLQQFTFTDVPVLNPDNWTFWWPYLIVVLTLEALYTVWLYRRGSWSRAVTAANAALAVLTTVPLVWLLAEEKFFNPAWVSTQDWGSTADPLSWLTGIVLVTAIVGALYDVIDVAVKTERARRGVHTPVPGTGAEYTNPI
ncbi:permease prefix domain 1-containing protein [Actinoplanes sp. DH11]|uniref:permease prefix domain 1-containing protein n=1 Tax=Actinoplanes sp. DH11 TaxID=2857011 RepID=UPI001E647C94|nr:permease prefix domain 1-containing protein [Actinoplanes sp. DH11]